MLPFVDRTTDARIRSITFTFRIPRLSLSPKFSFPAQPDGRDIEGRSCKNRRGGGGRGIAFVLAVTEKLQAFTGRAEVDSARLPSRGNFFIEFHFCRRRGNGDPDSARWNRFKIYPDLEIVSRGIARAERSCFIGRAGKLVGDWVSFYKFHLLMRSARRAFLGVTIVDCIDDVRDLLGEKITFIWWPVSSCEIPAKITVVRVFGRKQWCPGKIVNGLQVWKERRSPSLELFECSVYVNDERNQITSTSGTFFLVTNYLNYQFSTDSIISRVKINFTRKSPE